MKMFYNKILFVGLISQIAIVLGAEQGSEAIPKDLWCDDVPEFCNRYLDLPRPDCIAKFQENCIESPSQAVQQSNSSGHLQTDSGINPLGREDKRKPEPPQWLKDLVATVFKSKNFV
ncbi:uncharacterized protein LOC131995059 [Stomoxys calcitrans]|nr:uncharacterized protein LOC131995059 [Stomoxys calcitrans]